MERYLKDHEPQIKPEPIDMVEALETADWIKAELADADDDYDTEDAFGVDSSLLLKHEFLIKSEPSDLDDTDDDRLSLDELNIWDQRLSTIGSSAGGKTTDHSITSSGSSTGFLSSSSSTSSIHSLDGDAPPPYSSPLSLHGSGGVGATGATTAVSGPAASLTATTASPSAAVIKLTCSSSSSSATSGRLVAVASPLDRREQLTVKVASAASGRPSIPIQTLTPPSSPESAGSGGGSGSGGAA